MIRSMAKLTGFSEQEITKGIAGRVLKKWAGYTRVAKPAIIERNARLRALRGLELSRGKAGNRGSSITINAGIRGPAGLVWLRTEKKRFSLAGRIDPKTGRFIANWRHYRDGDWTDINEAAQDYGIALKRQRKLGKRAAGLARQSVIQIADSIGIDLAKVPGSGISSAGIAKARRAIATDGQPHINGYGTEQGSGGKYSVRLVNQYPFMIKSNIDAGLRFAMSGEVGYFRKNVSRGVFGSIRNIARAYPWLKVQLPEAD